jgi:hypothetical protein
MGANKTLGLHAVSGCVLPVLNNTVGIRGYILRGGAMNAIILAG